MRAANLQVAAGAINQAPASSPGGFTLSVQTLGRLTAPEEFGNIVLRAETNGSVTRLRDVARIELGAQDYTLNAYLDNKNATALGIFQRPGSNALATSDGIKAAMEELKKNFPPGIDYSVVYNPTEFIQASVDAVIDTLFEALLLVVDRGDPVPADLAGGDHPAARHPGVADRLVRRDVGGRHLVQHAVAVRPGAGDRHRGRRRHRRGRERRALPDPGHVAQGGGAQDHGRGRRRADRHLAGADRGVPADRLHHRPAGLVLQAVRHHHRGLDGDLGLRVADAVARAGGAAAQDARAVARRERPSRRCATGCCRPINWFFSQFNRGFEWLSNGYGRSRRGWSAWSWWCWWSMPACCSSPTTGWPARRPA